jgi:hypothetical protein
MRGGPCSAIGLLLLVAAISGLVAMPVSAEEPLPSLEPHPLLEPEPLPPFMAPDGTEDQRAALEPEPFEVREYQRNAGVTEEVARADLELQHRGAHIVELLEKTLGSRYAGVWFDNQNGEFVVPALPGITKDEVAERLEADKLELAFRVQSAQSSWNDLLANQRRLNEQLQWQIREKLIDTSLSARFNAVAISQADVASKAQEEQVLEAAEGLNIEVRIESRSTKRNWVPLDCTAGFAKVFACDAPHRTGVAFSANSEIAAPLCTQAFKAVDGAGRRYVLTAGHCVTNFVPPTPTDWQAFEASHGYEDRVAHYLGFTDYYQFPGRDWAKIRMWEGGYWDTSPWSTGLVVWPKMPAEFAKASNSDYKIFGEAQSYEGLQVCHSGIATGSSCALVTGLNGVGEYAQGNVSPLTVTGPMCADEGDSGGPMFSGNVAYRHSIWGR